MDDVSIVAILNAFTLMIIPILIGLGVIRPRSRTEYMKKRILRKLNELANSDKNKFFIPVGELGDTLIQKHNPILRMRFCEIFLESVRELDEKETMIIDRYKIPISLEINKPIEYLPKYHSKYFAYGSLRKIDPDKYIGLNNPECREHIESCEAAERSRSKQYRNSY